MAEQQQNIGKVERQKTNFRKKLQFIQQIKDSYKLIRKRSVFQ